MAKRGIIGQSGSDRAFDRITRNFDRTTGKYNPKEELKKQIKEAEKAVEAARAKKLLEPIEEIRFSGRYGNSGLYK